MPDATPACHVLVKVVPGARREEVAGWLGDRLKVRVSAPPEDGRANRAVCALIARELNCSPRAVSVVVGASSPLKTLQIHGLGAAAVESVFSSGPMQ